MATQTACITPPSCTEAGLICTLSPGIDPREWRYLCRFLGGLAPGEFDVVSTMIHDWQRFMEKALRAVERQASPGPIDPVAQAPLLSFGPSGIGGDYQIEFGGDNTAV